MAAETKATRTVTPKEGYILGEVSGNNGITLCMGYQSVRLDIGGRIPWAVKPGDVASLKAGYVELFELLDEELVERASGVKELLASLAKEYSRR